MNQIENQMNRKSARTYDFEKPGEQVHIPEQDADQIMNFLQMHQKFRIFKMNRCTCNYSMILWSICGRTMETKEETEEFNVELCTSNKFYV